MALFSKLTVYGRSESGKYALADRLVRDNAMLEGPFVLRDPSALSRFLALPGSAVGIVHATSVRVIVSRCKALNLGTVLFVPAPEEVSSDEALAMQQFHRALSAAPPGRSDLDLAGIVERYRQRTRKSKSDAFSQGIPCGNAGRNPASD
uniref:Uncharacterized protein n=1 Tax=Ochrobactrum sp. LM19 TaxID=1449781 RepID=A0A0D5A1F9_9HYPH|nr:hypothetical protein [Ochrobactrum sp. LM19]AJW30016.1 hypothetical protein pLM19O2_p71 [Ochrobactrum sp. LM19]